MLLFDLSGIVTQSCINLHQKSKHEVTVDVVRHVAFSSLLYYKKRFSNKFGKPIICADSKPYWREGVFEFYKKNRDAARDKSGIDWEAFSANFKEVQKDIDTYTPYPFIKVRRTEADDSIAILTQRAHAQREKIMIVSSDKDMLQLQDKYTGVQQYSPNRKRMLSAKDKDYGLLTHMVKGDTSDGIPNIFSPEDILMFPGTGLRQKSVSQKMLDEVHSLVDPFEWDMLDDDSRYKLKRNMRLIDTDMIPERIETWVLDKYESELAKNKKNNMQACVIKYKLRNLIQSVQDF